MEWWRAFPSLRVSGEPPPVSDLTHDSRLVKPGSAFVAVPGLHNDGHDFIEAALSAGATAVVVQTDHESQWAPFVGRVPLVVVEDSRAALGPLAAAVRGDPSEKLLLVGVTGTDGKTTTSHLI